ncbi:hypothetical protein PMAYCL1PPCAC_04776, partial [Pristionchus mayeri]
KMRSALVALLLVGLIECNNLCGPNCGCCNCGVQPVQPVQYPSFCTAQCNPTTPCSCGGETTTTKVPETTTTSTTTTSTTPKPTTTIPTTTAVATTQPPKCETPCSCKPTEGNPNGCSSCQSSCGCEPTNGNNNECSSCQSSCKCESEGGCSSCSNSPCGKEKGNDCSCDCKEGEKCDCPCKGSQVSVNVVQMDQAHETPTKSSSTIALLSSILCIVLARIL